MSQIDPNAVKTYLLDLQDRICAELSEEDGGGQHAMQVARALLPRAGLG